MRRPLSPDELKIWAAVLSTVRARPGRMPPKLVHLVLVNGKYIKPEDRDTTTLVEGDVLAIWPPVAGG